MSALTIAYVVRVVSFASMYCYFAERERMDKWPRYVKNMLSVRNQRSVAALINWTHSNDAVTAPTQGDIPYALRVLNDSRNRTFSTSTAYADEDVLAWRVYIGDCRLKARPVWYKPPGRTTGMNLGKDPVADVLNYYERRGEAVLRILKEEE